MKPAPEPPPRARPLARARALIRTEIGVNLHDSLLYGIGGAFAVLIAGVSLAAL
jgi:hypothetical protein